MNADELAQLPVFQQLQYQLSAHIRDPKNQPYAKASVVQKDSKLPGLVKMAVEPRRLKIYENLFFNNLFDFFSNLFPVLKSILGEARWVEITREYLQKHEAKTPLFHELGQEFIAFLQTEYQPLESDPPFMLELAHYEWVELAVKIEPQESTLNPEDLGLDWQSIYQLSPVAWPLVYEWPVHRLEANDLPSQKPEWVTTLLVYRDDEDAVQFMELSPVLYELLLAFMDNESQTVLQILTAMAEQMQQPVESLTGFAEQVLQDFIEHNLISPVEKGLK